MTSVTDAPGTHENEEGGPQLLGALGQVPLPFEEEWDEIPGATHWPRLRAAEATGEWIELRAWVEELLERFAHLDHHVVPYCWWRHNEHVEVLVALRDHERASFSSIAPATAPTDWFRALRDLSGMLRSFTAELACGASHQEAPVRARGGADEAWEGFVLADVDRRDAREIAAALLGEGAGEPDVHEGEAPHP